MKRVLATNLVPQGHAGAFKPYVYRDPERCSRERLIELAAHDAHIRRIQQLWSLPEMDEKMRRLGL